jgi:hypothetical protein
MVRRPSGDEGGGEDGSALQKRKFHTMKIADRISERKLNRMPAGLPKGLFNRMPTAMLGQPPGVMPDQMTDRMLKYMPDRMSLGGNLSKKIICIYSLCRKYLFCFFGTGAWYGNSLGLLVFPIRYEAARTLMT